MNKEEKILRLKKKENKKYYKGYMIVFILTMILLRFVCELGSNIPTFIQSSVIKEFFVNDNTTYDEGLSNYTIVSLLASSVYVIAILYKPLADIIGRKIIILFNVIGILIGFIFFNNSSNFYIYAIGLAVTTLFMQNDVQMVYVVETVNNKNSGKVFGIIKSVGILGLVIIPFLREFIMNNDSTKWRDVFLVPIILTIITLILLIIFLRETNVFLNKKINILEGTEVIVQEKNELKLSESIKYILKNKQLRIQVFAYILYGLCSMACYMYVESLMTTNGMTTVDVTKALYVYPIVYALLAFIAGFIADRFGRKKVVVPAGFFVSIGFLLFIIAIKLKLNPYFIGFLNGLYLGSYWVMGDYILFLFIENVPTEMRTSTITGSNILMMVGSILGVTLEILLIRFIGITLASLIVIIPFSLISAFIVLFKIKETKGIDLETIKKEV